MKDLYLLNYFLMFIKYIVGTSGKGKVQENKDLDLSLVYDIFFQFFKFIILSLCHLTRNFEDE